MRCALDLEKMRLPSVKITLISDKPHFEYHAALYRVVTGRSPLEVCIPLREIFEGRNIELLEDAAVSIDFNSRVLKGSSGSRHSYDHLVLALGSETAYFDIPGLKELSYGFKSINEAIRLKRYLHELFKNDKLKSADKNNLAHIVVVGGGASGVELAGELSVYVKKLAAKHKFDRSLVKIDLVEAASKILPSMPKDFTERIEKRLKELNVNIIAGRPVIKEDIEKIYLKDMEMKTKTVIWTSGVRSNVFYSEAGGFEMDKIGRVRVDEFMRAKGFSNIFVLGDAAATKYSGMAQTALGDGGCVAAIIRDDILGFPHKPYLPKKPSYAIPAGPGWAAFMAGNLKIYGLLGWWLRRLKDFKFFLSILTLKKAMLVFQNGKKLCETCSICSKEI